MTGVQTCALPILVHQTTLPYSPYQNAKQESFWGRVEGRLMAMLEGEQALPLELLNEATQAWVEQEYHRTVHTELKVTPLARYLAGPSVARKCPDSGVLRDAFRIEVPRRARRADGTLSLGGVRFEIPARLQHLSVVHVRYARWDFSRVDLIEARTGQILCPIRPLDKAATPMASADALTPWGATSRRCRPRDWRRCCASCSPSTPPPACRRPTCLRPSPHHPRQPIQTNEP